MDPQGVESSSRPPHNSLRHHLRNNIGTCFILAGWGHTLHVWLGSTQYIMIFGVYSKVWATYLPVTLHWYYQQVSPPLHQRTSSNCLQDEATYTRPATSSTESLEPGNNNNFLSLMLFSAIKYVEWMTVIPWKKKIIRDSDFTLSSRYRSSSLDWDR